MRDRRRKEGEGRSVKRRTPNKEEKKKRKINKARGGRRTKGGKR